jgi:hypothetical protein
MLREEKEFLTIFKKKQFKGGVYFKNKNLRGVNSTAFLNFLKKDSLIS